MRAAACCEHGPGTRHRAKCQRPLEALRASPECWAELPCRIISPIPDRRKGILFTKRQTDMPSDQKMLFFTPELYRRFNSRDQAEALAADAEMRAEINQGLVAVLRSFIADQKSGVSIFIADQVKGWDMAQLISLIEINVGKDLQYIRFNGSLIGGLAGLALYTLEYLLRLV